MSTEYLRGKSVRCLEHTYNTNRTFTPGKVYPVTGVTGEPNLALSGVLGAGGYTIMDNKGDYQYMLDPREGWDAHGTFEVVE